MDIRSIDSDLKLRCLQVGLCPDFAAQGGEATLNHGLTPTAARCRRLAAAGGTSHRPQPFRSFILNGPHRHGAGLTTSH